MFNDEKATPKNEAHLPISGSSVLKTESGAAFTYVILTGLISVVQHVAKLEWSFSRAAGKAV